MKEYIKNNKKYLIVGIYTLLILSIAHLSIYGTSNSKYIDKKDYALVYQTKLNKLYQKNELAITYSKNKSTREKIYLSFKLKRNEVGIDSKLTDKYFIEIPKACEFVDDSISEYTFPPEKNEPTIAIMCDVNDESILDNNDVFDIYIKIKEQIGKEDKFLYTDGIYSAMSKSDYLTKEFPEDIKPTKEFKISKNNNNWQQVNGDIYDELVYNLEKYYYPTYVDEVYGNFANRIKYYIQGETKENGGYIKSYKGKTSVTTSDSIPGLKITDDGNNYIFRRYY